MIEKCHLRPTINVTEISQIKEITIKTISQETTILQIKTVNQEIMEILQISRIKVTMVFVIILTIPKTVIQEITNSHHTIPILGKTSHMTKNTQNKMFSEIMNKLQNSIMTKRIGNPAVILEVDNIIKMDITEQIVPILIDQDHQDSERIKIKLKIPIG